MFKIKSVLFCKTKKTPQAISEKTAAELHSFLCGCKTCYKLYPIFTLSNSTPRVLLATHRNIDARMAQLTDTFTSQITENMERTYIMIKPDGVQRGLVGEIIKRFEQRGFQLSALKLVQV